LTVAVLLVLAGISLLVGSLLIFRGRSNDMFEDFEEKFPGKCAVCAYHAYGIRNGHVKPGTVPDDHRCPEKWARWKGALHPRE
jgi:hypothetical protein